MTGYECFLCVADCALVEAVTQQALTTETLV